MHNKFRYITYVLLFIISFLFFYNNTYKSLYSDISSKSSFTYEGSVSNESSQYEITFIFISSSTCPFCKDKKLPKIIDNIKVKLENKSNKSDYNFTALGISVDRNVNRGIESLKKFGDFDEINIGHGWLNIGDLRYIYDEIKGPATIPQILITKRKYQFSKMETGFHKIGISKEIQILRRVGLDKIKKWYKSGMPLPTDF